MKFIIERTFPNIILERDLAALGDGDAVDL
jgi:hypothetical protein